MADTGKDFVTAISVISSMLRFEFPALIEIFFWISLS